MLTSILLVSLYWQAFCLSITQNNFNDKHFVCQSRKMFQWQAFSFSITEKMFQWQAFCFSLTEKMFQWQGKSMSKIKVADKILLRLFLLTSFLLVSQAQKACQKKKKKKFNNWQAKSLSVTQLFYILTSFMLVINKKKEQWQAFCFSNKRKSLLLVSILLTNKKLVSKRQKAEGWEQKASRTEAFRYTWALKWRYIYIY